MNVHRQCQFNISMRAFAGWIQASCLRRCCHLLFPGCYYAHKLTAHQDVYETLKDSEGVRPMTAELCTCFCLCWHMGRSLGSGRTSCCSWADVNFWGPSKHTITKRFVRTVPIQWYLKLWHLFNANLHYQICLQSSSLSAAFWILEPQALTQGFVWFLLQMRCKNVEGLRRGMLTRSLRAETQTHQLCCLPPLPDLQNVVCTPPWSSASGADVPQFVWRRCWRGKKLESMMTGVKRKRMRRRVEGPHFPLLHQLLPFGLEDRKCRPGWLHWGKGGTEVTRSGRCIR